MAMKVSPFQGLQNMACMELLVSMKGIEKISNIIATKWLRNQLLEPGLKIACMQGKGEGVFEVINATHPTAAANRIANLREGLL